LTDWDLKVRFSTKDEAKENWGLCIPSKTTKSALIHIANPRWFKEEDKEIQGWMWDPEVTLVHECLHIPFSIFDFPVGSIKHTVEEQVVCTLAQLLVALDRRDESILNPNNPKRLSKAARID
jgi:hypothetical protein